MPAQSPHALVKRLEAEIARLVSNAQAAGLIEAPVQRDIKRLRRDLADARLDVRDYELAETRGEQIELGKAANERLGQVERAVLGASQYNIFSAIEVAQLSAAITYLQERLV